MPLTLVAEKGADMRWVWLLGHLYQTCLRLVIFPCASCWNDPRRADVHLSGNIPLMLVDDMTLGMQVVW